MRRACFIIGSARASPDRPTWRNVDVPSHAVRDNLPLELISQTVQCQQSVYAADDVPSVKFHNFNFFFFSYIFLFNHQLSRICETIYLEYPSSSMELDIFIVFLKRRTTRAMSFPCSASIWVPTRALGVRKARVRFNSSFLILMGVTDWYRLSGVRNRRVWLYEIVEPHLNHPTICLYVHTEAVAAAACIFKSLLVINKFNRASHKLLTFHVRVDAFRGFDVSLTNYHGSRSIHICIRSHEIRITFKLTNL